MAERIEHVGEPHQVGLGGLEAQLGLVPARVQAGDAGGLLDQRAAFGRLGIDEGADAALGDDRRRLRAAGRVGE